MHDDLSLPRHLYCSLIEISMLKLTYCRFSLKEETNDSINKATKVHKNSYIFSYEFNKCLEIIGDTTRI